mmetsp:Transcript_41247/g.113458  ORF Transcript_41247/g.113458 Transcript_41247/m.113458 type:complete len:246 (-) Transcript_41247:35-772(-)
MKPPESACRSYASSSRSSFASSRAQPRRTSADAAASGPATRSANASQAQSAAHAARAAAAAASGLGDGRGDSSPTFAASRSGQAAGGEAARPKRSVRASAAASASIARVASSLSPAVSSSLEKAGDTNISTDVNPAAASTNGPSTSQPAAPQCNRNDRGVISSTISETSPSVSLPVATISSFASSRTVVWLTATPKRLASTAALPASCAASGPPQARIAHSFRSQVAHRRAMRSAEGCTVAALAG